MGKEVMGRLVSCVRLHTRHGVGLRNFTCTNLNGKRIALKRKGILFPLQYGGVKIEKSWVHFQATIDQIAKKEVLDLLRNIERDVDRSVVDRS